MGDIWVHVQMKECCRETLKDLDQRKKKAKHKGGVLGMPSLFEAFSEKTIDAAKAATPDGGSGEAEVEGELEALVRAACEKICGQHAESHEEKGEMTEGTFWRDFGRAVRATNGST